MLCPEGDVITRDNKWIAYVLPLVIGPAWLYYALLFIFLYGLGVQLTFSIELGKYEFYLVNIVTPLLGGYLGGLFTPSTGSGIKSSFQGSFYGAIGVIFTTNLILYLVNPSFFFPFALYIILLIVIFGIAVIISTIAALGGYLGAKTNLRT